MKVTTTGAHYVVFDDVLSARGLEQARANAVVVTYRRHSTTALHPVWRHSDGGQLIGGRFGLDGEAPVADLSPELAEVLEELGAHDETRRVVGTKGDAWAAM